MIIQTASGPRKEKRLLITSTYLPISQQVFFNMGCGTSSNQWHSLARCFFNKNAPFLPSFSLLKHLYIQLTVNI